MPLKSKKDFHILVADVYLESYVPDKIEGHYDRIRCAWVQL
jgi:hypothetical protein